MIRLIKPSPNANVGDATDNVVNTPSSTKRTTGAGLMQSPSDGQYTTKPQFKKMGSSMGGHDQLLRTVRAAAPKDGSGDFTASAGGKPAMMMSEPRTCPADDAEEPRAACMLVVDDEPDIRLLVRFVLEDEDHLSIVGEAGTASEAIRQWNRLAPDIVVLDYQLPDGTGTDVAQQMLADRPDTIVVLYSAFLTPDIRKRAQEIGIHSCISKERALELGHLLAQALDPPTP